MSLKKAWIRAISLASVIAAVAPAQGQVPAPSGSAGAGAPVSPEAAAHFEMGTRHYNLQEWAEAIKEYKEAYRLAPRPETLWSIAQAQRLGGDHDAAIMTYQAFLRTSPSERQAAMANEAIVKCQAALLDKRRADPNPPQAVSTKRGDSPPPVASSAPAATDTSAAPGPSAAPAPAAPGHWYSDVLGDVLFVGGAAGLVFGGVALGVGNARAGDANAATDYAAFDRTRGEGPPLQTAGVLGLTLGGALLAAGVVRFLLVARRPTVETSTLDLRAPVHASLPPSPTRRTAVDTLIGVGASPSGVVVRVTGQF